LRYGKGTIIFEDKNFVLTSSYSHCEFFWKPFVEIVKGKCHIENNELIVSNIEGRYSDYNGKWGRLGR